MDCNNVFDFMHRRCNQQRSTAFFPGRQFRSLDVFEVHNLKLGPVPLILGGPCNPGVLIEVSALWLPRVIEISLVRHMHILIDTERSETILILPANMTTRRL